MTNRICLCIFLVPVLSHCNTQDEVPGTEITITTRALTGIVSGPAGGRMVELSFDEITLAIGDIHLIPAGPPTDDATATIAGGDYTTEALSGPFHIQFPTDQRFSERELVSSFVPNGSYDGIRFKLSGLEGGAMEGNTAALFVSGKIGGNKFELWFNSRQVIEIGDSIFCPGNGEPLFVMLFFNFGHLFGTADGIDLSKAEDGDQDGIIEVGNNDDGNEWLIEQLPELIESNIYLVSGQ